MNVNFDDDVQFICSNREDKSKGQFVCHGHGRGDHLIPTHHGRNDHKFFIYPMDKNLVNPQWDWRTEELCNNHHFVKDHPDGIKEYDCLGHSQTFHGDPKRNNSFWLYSEGQHGPNTGIWDFNTINPFEVCSHHKKHENNHFECLGHSHLGDSLVPTYHGDP